ncbi:MAG: DUF2786 domain-containing protein [Gammaproteobacteria bacterium]|nr:DUF2786 domain-containing protein [Gammaproteobacteria bacterium]
MEQNKLIDRIKKLLALSANNPNPHEAQVALKRAQKLLAENDMSMTSLTEVESEDIGESHGKNVQRWNRTIYSAITDLYQCEYIINPNPPARHIVIGTLANRTTAILIINYVLKAIRMESKGKSASFRNGAALGVYQSCQEILEEEKKNKKVIIPGTGLVAADIRLVRSSANDRYINDEHGDVRAGRQSRSYYSQAGHEFGASLSVNPQINNNQYAIS